MAELRTFQSIILAKSQIKVFTGHFFIFFLLMSVFEITLGPSNGPW